MLALLIVSATLTVALGMIQPRWGFVALLALAAYTRQLGAGAVERRLAPFDLALAGLALVWLWRTWRGGSAHTVAARLQIYLPVILFGALAVLRAPWVPHPGISLITAAVYALLVAAALLVEDAARRYGPEFVYRAIVVVATIVAALCIYEFIAMQLKWPTIWEETFRILGPFKNPNQTGSYFAMAIPLTMGALADTQAVGLASWLLVPALLVQGLALFLTFSRTSIAATAGSFGLFALLAAAGRRGHAWRGRGLWKALVAPLLIAALAAGLIAVHKPTRDTVLWKTRSLMQAFGLVGGEGGFSGHLIQAALRSWANQPLLGVGLGNFPYVNPAPNDSAGFEVHGSYLAILTETGVVGVLLMGLFLFTLVRRLWQAIRAPAGNLPRALQVGAASALGALMATGVWDTFLRKRHFWLLAGLALVLCSTESKPEEADRDEVAADGLRVVPEADLEAGLQAVEQADLRVSNPALHPAWLRSWWRHYGHGLQVRFLLVYEDERLVGFAPMGWHDLGGCRWYRMLGQGVSSYLEPAALPGTEGAVARALIRWFEAREGCTAVTFYDLNFALPSSQALSGALRYPGRQVDRFWLYACPYMRLKSNMAEVLQSRLSVRRHQQLRRHERRLQGLGMTEFRIFSSPSQIAALTALLPEMQVVHRSRFAGVVNPVLKDRFWSFLAEVIPHMLGSGLEVSTMTVGGRLVAFTVASPMGEWYVDYVPAIDPAFSALSPGHLHQMRLFQSVGERGFRMFDFSKGETEFKRLWQDGATHNEAYVLWVRPGITGTALRLMYRFAYRARLWARRRRITHWVRILPRLVRSWLPTVRAHIGPVSGNPPARLTWTPALTGMAYLPLPVQESVVRQMLAGPGAWEVAIGPGDREAYLRAREQGPFRLTWHRRWR